MLFNLFFMFTFLLKKYDERKQIFLLKFFSTQKKIKIKINLILIMRGSSVFLFISFFSTKRPKKYFKQGQIFDESTNWIQFVVTKKAKKNYQKAQPSTSFE